MAPLVVVEYWSFEIRYDQTGEALKLTDIHEDFSENARFGMH